MDKTKQNKFGKNHNKRRTIYFQFLCCSNRKALSSTDNRIYFAVDSDMIGLLSRNHIKNFSSVGWRKPMHRTLMSSIKFFLRNLYVGHFIKKWSSSSTSSGQKGHFRSEWYMFWCLPFSIARLWSESLNLVRAVLFFVDNWYYTDKVKTWKQYY